MSAVLACACHAGPEEADAWSDTFERTGGFGWSGGDAAYSVPLPNDRTLWLFGDSYLSEVDDGMRTNVQHRFGNTIAIQHHPAPGDDPDGVTSVLDFDWADPSTGGWLPIFDSTLERNPPPSLTAARNLDYPVVSWPLHGAVVGDDLVLFNAAVTLANCDDCGILNFKVHGAVASRIVGVDRPYAQWGFESGVGWTADAQPEQRMIERGWAAPDLDDASGLLWGTWVHADADDRVLVFGHRVETGNRELVVARIDGVNSAKDLMDDSTWRFWDGTEWSSEPGTAAAIAKDTAVEISIVSVPPSEGSGYAMIHSGPDPSAGEIHVATADEPWGPYEKEYTLSLDECPIDGFDEQTAPIAYAAKAHPHLSDDDSVLVSVVVITNEAMAGSGMNAATHHYAPRFVRIPWEEIFRHDGSAPFRCRWPFVD